MPADRAVVHKIAWREVFPWLLLVRVFRLATDVRLLLLGTCGILATAAGWWGIGWAFSGTKDKDLSRLLASYQSVPWTTSSKNDAEGARAAGSPFLPSLQPGTLADPPRWEAFPTNPLLAPWQQLSSPFRQILARRGSFGDLSHVGLAFLLCCALWACAVWALFGGAITRMAAMVLGREEKIGVRQALAFARSRWWAYFSAPLLPLLGLLLASVPMLLAGLMMRADVGILIASIGWPLILVFSVLATIFLVAVTFGWPLMWCTVSVEGRDSFDALNRCYSYVYHRPLEYLFYIAVATVLGALGGLVVYYFAEAVIYLPNWVASWASGGERMDRIVGFSGRFSSSAQTGLNLLGVWNGLVRLIALGYVYSYFWSAFTAIYLLVRRDEDGTELDEVFVPEKQARTSELPALKLDPAGVPVVTPDEPGAESTAEAAAELHASVPTPPCDANVDGESGTQGRSAD